MSCIYKHQILPIIEMQVGSNCILSGLPRMPAFLDALARDEQQFITSAQSLPVTEVGHRRSVQRRTSCVRLQPDQMKIMYVIACLRRSAQLRSHACAIVEVITMLQLCCTVSHGCLAMPTIMMDSNLLPICTPSTYFRSYCGRGGKPSVSTHPSS